jgi:ubiquitin-conjugating enzyme E2 J2
MMAQLKKATAEPNEFVKFALKSEDETHIWYVLLNNFPGNNGEFESGEYLVRVEMPENFPFEPPHFYFLTETGLYGVEKKVCISIGEYHKDQYRAALGVSGFCNQLVSGLIGWKEMGGGIEIHKTTDDAKKRLAIKSRESNWRLYPDLMRKIEESYATYSGKWDLTKIPESTRILLKLGTTTTTTSSSAVANSDRVATSSAPVPIANSNRAVEQLTETVANIKIN